MFRNFPLSSLTPSVDLLRLDILCLTRFEYFDQHGENGFFETLQSEMMPKTCEFHISGPSLLTTTLLHANRQDWDGRPAFNSIDLRQMSLDVFHPVRIFT